MHSCLSVKNISKEIQEFNDGKLTDHSRLTDLPSLYQSSNESIILGTDSVKKLIESNSTVNVDELVRLSVLIPTFDTTVKFMFNTTLFIITIDDIYCGFNIQRNTNIFDYTRGLNAKNPIWYMKKQLEKVIHTYLTQHNVTGNFFPPIINLKLSCALLNVTFTEITYQLNRLLEPLRLSKEAKKQQTGLLSGGFTYLDPYPYIRGGIHKIRRSYKKTLRKKYKKPKKTKHVKRFTYKLKSKNSKNYKYVKYYI